MRQVDEHEHIWAECLREECIPHSACIPCGIDPDELDK